MLLLYVNIVCFREYNAREARWKKEGVRQRKREYDGKQTSCGYQWDQWFILMGMFSKGLCKGFLFRSCTCKKEVGTHHSAPMSRWTQICPTQQLLTISQGYTRAGPLTRGGIMGSWCTGASHTSASKEKLQCLGTRGNVVGAWGKVLASWSSMNWVRAHKEFAVATARQEQVVKGPGISKVKRTKTGCLCDSGSFCLCHFPSLDPSFSFLIFVFY